MQEQINEKTVALSIKTAKLTAEVLQKAIRKMLNARKNKAPKQYKGKQTLKHLMKQNTGVSSMEITDANIKPLFLVAPLSVSAVPYLQSVQYVRLDTH